MTPYERRHHRILFWWKRLTPQQHERFIVWLFSIEGIAEALQKALRSNTARHEFLTVYLPEVLTDEEKAERADAFLKAFKEWLQQEKKRKRQDPDE
ncbi:MAG: hypothetical protein AAB402_04795 [Patescibacteria group bacterium]